MDQHLPLAQFGLRVSRSKFAQFLIYWIALSPKGLTL